MTQVDDLMEEATRAARDGDYARAGRLLDEANAIDPPPCHVEGHGWAVAALRRPDSFVYVCDACLQARVSIWLEEERRPQLTVTPLYHGPRDAPVPRELT